MLEKDFKDVVLNIKNEVSKNLITLYFKLGKLISENSKDVKISIKTDEKLQQLAAIFSLGT